MSRNHFGQPVARSHRDISREHLGKAKCHACGKSVPICDLDAKPGPGHWSAEALAEAADTGKDFLRLECKDCYGPNWAPGP